ncbi:unnamed protein product [Closterium sp. NIES-54]
MGDVMYYLGMHVERDLDKGVLRLHQRKYCEGLAEKYGLQDGGKPATPLPSGFTVEPCADEEVVGESDRKLFHSMVGALNYAANHTRPDIAFATSRLASVVSRPSHEQLEAAKRLVRYVSTTASVGLEYSAVRQRLQRGAADLGKGEILLTCYTEASFNSVKADGTSIGGYVCLFGGGAVSWHSKKQNELAKNACLHGLTKHIRPKWHWVRRLLDKEVRLEIVKTHQQAADILTKRMAESEHWKGMKLAGMRSGDAAEKRNEPPPSKIEALDGSNYEEWSRLMQSACKRYKLLKLAMEEEKMSEQGDARNRWIKKSVVLCDLVLQSVNNDMFQYIKDLVELDDSIPKVWKLLRDVIQPNTLPMVIVLEKDLAARFMRSSNDVKPVLDKIKDTYARMAAAGSNVSQMQQCTKIILMLENSWDNLIPTFNTQQDQWTPEWLRQQILQEDFRRRHTGGGAANKTAEGYGAAGGSRGRGGGRGRGRGRGFGRGRGRGDYNEGHGSFGGRGSTRMEGACWYCKKAGHPWFTCFSRPKGWVPPGMKPPSGECARGGAVQGSGAQGDGAHGKANPGMFFMVEDVKGSEGAVGSVGKVVMHPLTHWVIDSGCTSHMTPRADLLDEVKPRGKIKFVAAASSALLPVIGVGNAKVIGANGGLVGLGNVLLVEGLSANLLSVRWLQKSKAKVTFEPTSCRAKLGKLLLWSLEEKSSCIKDLWQLPIIPWNGKPPATAAAAAKAKATAGGEEIAPTDRALDAVKKGEVAAAVLKEWMPRAERESGHKVKVIRTDNGGQFIGADFAAVLKKKGIQHQLTVPYNPQPNGVAERFNRTLQEGARTLLGRAGLPDPFWVTALRLVALVKNRVLATVGDKQWVPYTKWYGSAPAVNMLRAYGCMVVFHVPKEKRGKLEASGRWGVHVGLAKDHKGWLIWDLTSQKLSVSRDVKLLESLYYKEWKQQQQQKLPTTPLIIEADEVQRPSRQVQVTVSDEEISGELYMLQPEGLDDGSGRVCRLKKANYGLKQAPRAWYHKLEETLLAGGFKKSECDHSLFLLQEKEQLLMLLVYVDDILLLSDSSAMIEHVEEMLEMQFKCSKMGDVKYSLGMHVERDLDKGVLRLHQRKYLFTVEPCADEEVVGESDRKLFHSMVGALNYAANHTRPDIAFATSWLASVVSRLSHEQLETAKRLVRYVSATASVGLEYNAMRQSQQRGAADLGKGEMLLTCYTDASFNSVKADGTSIGGYVCLFGGGVVSWRSKK